MNKYDFRRAEWGDVPAIGNILKDAIQRRKADGSNQWQDGYPNEDVVRRDIDLGEGYVLMDHDRVVGYTAVIINNEPAYESIVGNWLTNGDFVVVHRVAVAQSHLGRALSQTILKFVEDFAVKHNIYSVKADTNFDNYPMMKIFDKLGYEYCGEVYFRGSPRRAYDKVLSK